MIYLSKILPLFVLPVGMTLILLIAGLLLRRRALMWIGVVLLWVSSTPLVGDTLTQTLEAGAVRGLATEAPVADAIVVLSAGRVTAPGVDAISEWGDPDRFFAGVELFQAGKAPVLVFTGGWVPWAAETRREGDVLKGYATAMGVPADRILTTGPVVNTAEEATAVAELLRAHLGTPPKIILVTSAFHVPRARKLFEAAGLPVTPFPVDFGGSVGATAGVLDILPTAAALEQTHRAVREMYGRLYYWAVSVW